MRTSHGTRPTRSTTAGRRSSGARVAVLVVALAALVGACGDDGPGEDAVPAPPVTQFATGPFADVPLPVGAAPVAADEQGDAQRSFAVDGLDPERVAEAMAEDLAATGWDEVEALAATTDGYVGTYRRDGEQVVIRISASPSDGDEGGAAQGSLIVLSRG